MFANDQKPHLSFEDVHDFLTADGKPYKKTKNGGQYCCPTHDDTNPSLSVTQGNDGSLLVYCFACQNGEAFKFLWDHLKGSAEYQPRFTPKPPKAEKPKKYWETLEAACAALEYHKPTWKRFEPWIYRESSGAAVGAVVRWRNMDGGKEIRPYTRSCMGWASGGMPSPRPLYNLPALLLKPDETVYVLEGEKAADAAKSIGWLATTSAGGSKAAAKTDWLPLTGRSVTIIPDNDAPGWAYAEEVAAILHKIGAAEVRFLDLAKQFPSLPKGGDLADLVENGEVTV